MGALRSGNRLCETCDHFRADHPRGYACTQPDCECRVFKFTEVKPRKTKVVRRFTEGECAMISARLEAGATYAEVGRETRRAAATIAAKFPGFGGNAAREDVRNGTVALKAAWAIEDKRQEARRRVREAERAAIGRTVAGCAFDGGNVCDEPHYANGLCHTHYYQHRNGKELTPIKRRTL